MINTTSIYKILVKKVDDLEDEILASLSNLNVLTTFTAEELGMTEKEMELDKKKEVKKIDDYSSTREKMQKSINAIDKGDDVTIEMIIYDLPFLLPPNKKKDLL